MTLKEIFKEAIDNNVSQSDFYYYLNNKLNISKKDSISSWNDYMDNSNEILKDLLKSRKEPIQYIVGQYKYNDLIFKLNKNVLIPRQETIDLIEEFSFIKNKKLLDLCSGSGIIGLSFAKQNDVVLSDVSKKALLLSKENMNINNLSAKIISSDLFKNINEKFDVIITNPPYVPTKANLEQKVLNYEPHLALFAGDDGLDIIKIILKEFINYIKDKDNFIFIMEVDETHKEFLDSYCKKNKYNYILKNDLNDKFRYLIIKEGNWNEK
ncbi:MAG: peptide chain release factor N(5)-glutamine methyltransferase [Mycoplasma sp.]|nr:peptide chain release factor N(5)-glutamine methyltransferase [Mycoplasma sp.]